MSNVRTDRRTVPEPLKPTSLRGLGADACNEEYEGLVDARVQAQHLISASVYT